MKEEEKRRGRGREDGGAKIKAKKVWMLGSCMELLTLSRDPWFCLVNGYLLYPNLGFVRISS